MSKTPARAQKPPRLDNGHTFHPRTVAEWQSWFRLGYASRWSESQRFEARALLALIDAFNRSDQATVKVRLASAIRAARRSLGLFEPSPLEQQ